jgi:hypothetical protein
LLGNEGTTTISPPTDRTATSVKLFASKPTTFFPGREYIFFLGLRPKKEKKNGSRKKSYGWFGQKSRRRLPWVLGL